MGFLLKVIQSTSYEFHTLQQYADFFSRDDLDDNGREGQTPKKLIIYCNLRRMH